MAEPEENQDPESDQDDQNFPMEIENGHITDSNSGAEGQNSSEDEDLILVNVSTGEYDRDIPTTHGYLGKLNPLSGYTLFEEGDVLHNIFSIYTNTLVFPGFTLPLVMNNTFESRVLKNFMNENNKVFVLLCANSVYNGFYEYGVTMEIFETNERNNMLHIKAKGRQRCKRVTGSRIDNVAGRIKLITVKILAEPPIIGPLEDTQLFSLKNKRKWKLNNFDELNECRKFRRYHAAQFIWPTWVFEMNEVSYYTKILLQALSSFGRELVPSDPEKLSYWFVQNYHLNHRERLQIMGLRSTLERLKLEVIYLRLGRLICCKNCEVEITDPTKVFAMSKDGIQSNYVNPGGHVYETVTVLEAKNFQLLLGPSRQFSWFPGYAWTIMQCANCNNHLGWKFSSPDLTPKKFYGLANSGIKVISTKTLTDEEDLKDGRISFANDYVGLQL
ncbi:protein cereblon [Anthonomus grandis grandis]|uniref:protein cereblon n=1 Tax=Anthonomus grandis grandis TaxID=2921223 RepID=UPI002165A649|nr:protein cereblon [Anthonomus grandis grandis]